jgi:hypothetical protein
MYGWQIPSWSDLYAFGRSRLLQTSYYWVVLVPIAAYVCAELRDMAIQHQADPAATSPSDTSSAADAAESPESIAHAQRGVAGQWFDRQVGKLLGWLKDIHVPYSWQEFYFATVAFGIGWAWYAIRCPAIVKNYRHFARFREAGNGEEALRWHLGQVLSMQRKAFTVGGRKLGTLDVVQEFSQRFGTAGSQADVESMVLAKEPDLDTLVAAIRLEKGRLADAFHYVWRLADEPRPIDRAACTGFFALGSILILWVLGTGFWWVVKTLW